MKQTLVLLLCLVCGLTASGQTAAAEYEQAYDVAYTRKTDAYSRERLKLDVYYPKDQRECPVVVWFHGGGLTGGSKEIPEPLRGKGMVVVGVNYRLMPRVTIADCIDDAAEAVAWVFSHAADYHGSPRKVFVAGHSAGGYLTMMLGLDRRWLGRYGVEPDSIRGLMPFSGQAITHFAHRERHGRGNLQPSADEFAPLYWVRRTPVPMVLVTGDRELELFGRYEENAYLWRMMKLCGNPETYLYELDGYNHGDMARPAFHILLQHVGRILKGAGR